MPRKPPKATTENAGETPADGATPESIDTDITPEDAAAELDAAEGDIPDPEEPSVPEIPPPPMPTGRYEVLTNFLVTDATGKERLLAPGTTIRRELLTKRDAALGFKNGTLRHEMK